ncbi:hypothetical protein SAMN04487895_12745 [Paenibacillus sophorae]|uniref:Uncharacterized protein n=1 Tax=Paenibacillus sophorae TaxID=1333845 RepID=A0A1H8VT42_9BACL|nr:hypothetical protein [Paenibacillus sophorae]QWU15697.1 hypothetical protein KP014_28440 [Paenibacillus sophorae]SEP18599.1 hypothetical protein SAMN04487895_12745 [Paenibacillus sophorae]
MLNLFHPHSQKRLLEPVNPAPVQERGLRKIGEIRNDVDAWVRDLKAKPAVQWAGIQRNRALNEIAARRKLVRIKPHDKWAVYELCKAVYELAEIDRVNFNGASYWDMIQFIRVVIPFASPWGMNGVWEYYHSRRVQGCGMAYLQEPAAAEEERI